MFGGTKASKKLVAVVDVGSASAGVGILAINTAGPTTVVEYERVTLPYEDRSESALTTGVVTSLSEAGQKLLTRLAAGPNKNHQITTVYAVIDAPWIRSHTVHAAKSFEKETRIIGAMIKEAATSAISTDTEIDKNHLIESTVVRVELNGYPTGSPVGKMAHRLSVAVLLSDCDATIQSGVAEALARLFPGAKQTLRSGSRALVSVMSVIPDLGKDCVILAVMAEATNVLVMRDGLATQHVQIPEGVRTIVKRISEKSSPEETLSLLRMIERDECTGDVCDTMTASMARVEIDLARVYGEALTKIAVPTRLPPDLILITHRDLIPWLSTFFARIDFTQCTLTAQPFSVHALGHEELAQRITSETAAPADIELLIAGALVNTEEQA